MQIQKSVQNDQGDQWFGENQTAHPSKFWLTGCGQIIYRQSDLAGEPTNNHYGFFAPHTDGNNTTTNTHERAPNLPFHGVVFSDMRAIS